MKRFIANIWILLLLLKNFFHREKLFIKEEVKEILVIELSRMGDVVSMTKAILCLMENFKNSSFHFVVDEKYENLLKKLLTYYEMDLSKVKIFGFKDTDTIKGLRAARSAISKSKFDLICSMSPSFRNGFLALSLNSTFKIGFFRSNSVYTPFLEENLVETIGIKNFVPKRFINENIEQRGLKICEALGITLQREYKNNNLTPFQSKIIYPKPYIVVHPFAGWEYRTWNYKNYAKLISMILKKTDLNVVLIGSKDEKEKGAKIIELVDSKKIFPVFEENLNTILCLIPEAELFIGNDSGPLHLASIFGIPVIGIYGPAPPVLTAPQKKENYYFYKKVECSPCQQIECIRPHNTCMDQINVDEVLQKVFEFINLKIKLNE